MEGENLWTRRRLHSNLFFKKELVILTGFKLAVYRLAQFLLIQRFQSIQFKPYKGSRYQRIQVQAAKLVDASSLPRRGSGLDVNLTEMGAFPSKLIPSNSGFFISVYHLSYMSYSLSSKPNYCLLKAEFWWKILGSIISGSLNDSGALDKSPGWGPILLLPPTMGRKGWPLLLGR